MSFLLYTCDVQRKCGGDLNIPKPTKRRRGHASKAHANFARMPMPACSDWDPFPSRAKKTSLYIIPAHLRAVANRPLPCNVGGFGILFSNKKGTIISHRETSPQFGSAGNQHCIHWGCGGAVRRGWRGRFFRSGRTRVRWCCIAIIVCALCGSWMMLLFVGTTTSCRHVYERGFVGAVGAV